jgi:hypothetical protein
VNIQLATSVSLTEIIDKNRRPDRDAVKVFEVTAGDGIYRILAKDELDAYKVYLEEYK